MYVNSISTHLCFLYVIAYSVVTIQKPCLILFHGSHYGPSKFLDAFLPYAPNLVFIPKEAVTHVPSTNVTIEAKANQADVARLQILEGKHQQVNSDIGASGTLYVKVVLSSW